MHRVALFVEGQAEQIFIREMLLKRFAFDAHEISICCLKLVAERFEPAEYDYGGEDALNHFLIINAGNDNKVLSAMMHRRERLVSEEYRMIIGLRDMYCAFYREQAPFSVNPELNQEIVLAARQQIEQAGVSDVIIDFAIMEVETWMLALLDKWKGGLSDAEILRFFDPGGALETIYHPVDVVKSITSVTGDPYDKHAKQVNTIMANIGWEDYRTLYLSNRCPSFNAFVDDLRIMPE